MMHVEADEKLFPARAGVILTKEEQLDIARPFPRAGGGDPKQITAKEYDRCFSPRGRGVIL